MGASIGISENLTAFFGDEVGVSFKAFSNPSGHLFDGRGGFFKGNGGLLNDRRVNFLDRFGVRHAGRSDRNGHGYQK